MDAIQFLKKEHVTAKAALEASWKPLRWCGASSGRSCHWSWKRTSRTGRNLPQDQQGVGPGEAEGSR
jgi:hypothetical protein